jgi:hypothetical protein
MSFGKDWSTEIEKVTPQSNIQDGKYAPSWPFRAIICGESGSGKTFLLNSMLCGDNPDETIHFEEIYVCAKDIEEPAYKILRKTLERVEVTLGQLMFEKGMAVSAEPHKIGFWFTDPIEMIGVLNSLDPERRHLIVFDDQQLNQRGPALKVMQEYFQRARKQNCSMFFIAQSYYGTDRFIRLNCDYKFIFAPRGRREINMLADAIGLDREKFKEEAMKAWEKPRGWIMIDKYNRLHVGFGPAVEIGL